MDKSKDFWRCKTSQAKYIVNSNTKLVLKICHTFFTFSEAKSKFLNMFSGVHIIQKKSYNYPLPLPENQFCTHKEWHFWGVSSLFCLIFSLSPIFIIFSPGPIYFPCSSSPPPHSILQNINPCMLKKYVYAWAEVIYSLD